MPELPEVETVRHTLRRKVLNKKIVDVDIRYRNIIKTDYEVFKKAIQNQTIQEVNRYGKYLLFYLDTDVLISHLRMEGKYHIRKPSDPIEKHEHIIFHFSDQTELRYDDVRKFGTMHLKPINQVYLGSPLEKLGLEPFDQDFTVAYLKRKLNNKRNIKSSLLDQTIVAGLGNIYVNEVLFLAKIHPEKLSHVLTGKEVKKIIDASRIILDKAITLGGTTIRSYYSDDNITGRFQNELLVHDKKGQLCKECGHVIEKIKVSGRGTYYCPHCQKK